MRVLQCGSTAYQGGVANAVKGLCVSLRRLGHDVALYTDGGDLSELTAKGVTVELAELWTKPGPLLRSTRKLRALMRAFKPDIVHVHGRSVALRAFLAGRKADWFTLHNTHLTHKQGFYDVGWVRKHFSPWGKGVFVLDDLAKDYLAREFGVPESRIVRIQNGIDCSKFRPPSKTERGEARKALSVAEAAMFVAFVGRLHPSKQPEAVIAAAKHFPNVRFAIVGDGEMREQVEREANGVKNLSLHAWMDPLSVYWAADLAVMPSLFEGYGLVAAEAIACGTPVLRSNTGGAIHMMREGVTGFTCDTSVESFVTTLGRVLEKPAELIAMRDKARAFAVQNLDVDIATQRMVEAYQR